MANILLDYVMKFSEIEGTGSVDLSYLSKAAYIVKPSSTNQATLPQLVQVTAGTNLPDYTDNTELSQFFAGGMTSIYLVVTDTLAQADNLLDQTTFFTAGVSTDFTASEAESFTPDSFTGVFFSISSSQEAAAAQAKEVIEFNEDVEEQLLAIEDMTGDLSPNTEELPEAIIQGAKDIANIRNRCVFLDENYKGNGACYAFGKLLSGTFWRDQQYIAPSNTSNVTAISDLGVADDLFDSRVSFYLSDDQYGFRLAAFFAGSKSITYPYINEEIKRNLQSAALNYISVNQPRKTSTERIRAQSRLQDVLETYEVAPYEYLNPEEDNSITLFNGLESYVWIGNTIYEVAPPIWRVEIEATQLGG